MTIKIGDYVSIKKLKQTGVILSIQGQKTRVQIGNLTISCMLGDLSSTPPPSMNPDRPKPITLSKSTKHTADSLDLHGFTVGDATLALEQFFSDAILADKRVVDIVHGFGSGRVQKAVHDFLSTAEFVGRFELSEFNRGTTRVYLKKITL